MFKKASAAVLLGGGGAYAAYSTYWGRRSRNALVSPADVLQNQSDGINRLYSVLGNDVTKARTALEQQNVTVYQFSTCPFSGKLRAFLDSVGVGYNIVEVNPLTKGELKGFAYKKVPQMVIDMQDNNNQPAPLVLVDSMEIVSILSPVFMDQQAEEVPKLREWASDVLGKYVLVNIGDRITDIPSNARQLNGIDNLSLGGKLKHITVGTLMFIVSHLSTRKKLEKLGYDVSEPRVGLHREMNKFCNSIKGPFHGGRKPDAADTDVYGILSAVEGHNMHTEVANGDCKDWMREMRKHIAAHKRSLGDK